MRVSSGLDRRWFVLVGPTAVGKTAVAERLALRWQAEIIVADSRQIYRGMNVGTHKPSALCQMRVPRHMIDRIDPEAFFSAGTYKKQAEEVIHALQGARFLIEGGTGLYLRALLEGLWEGPPASWALRQQWYNEEQEAPGVLHLRLAQVDPTSAATLHVHDLPKIVRALEVYHTTGHPLSYWHRTHRETRKRRPCFIVGLRRNRSDLYTRIDNRVDQQIKDGLIEETRQFAHLSADFPSMRGLGYRQMLPYVKGERSLTEATTLLKRDTRRFSKRQMSWFEADPEIHWVDLGPDETPEEIAESICATCDRHATFYEKTG